jgi:hypothetical protein
LIAVKNDSIKQNDIINVDDEEGQRRVKDFVKSIITCKLQPNLIAGGIDHDEENGDEEGTGGSVTENDKIAFKTLFNPSSFVNLGDVGNGQKLYVFTF